MHLTQQTDYAMRVLIYAAVNPDRLVKIKAIAQAYQISHSHVMKVATMLVKGGFLNSTRGKGGGLTLAHKPENIIIGHVVRHMEDLKIISCMHEDKPCIISESCRLVGMLHHAGRAFIEHLDQYTLADVIAKPADWTALQVQDQ
ncbi:MAG: Rrf2 family transcriptional regulator [Neisseria sp.]|nr:Rrf2 family transcriptional regulator [Neisseria sp.]